MVDAKAQKVDATARAWMPFLEMKDKQPDGSFAELKMAWDEQNIYLCSHA